MLRVVLVLAKRAVLLIFLDDASFLSDLHPDCLNAQDSQQPHGFLQISDLVMQHLID